MKITSWFALQCLRFLPERSGQPSRLPAPCVSYPSNPFWIPKTTRSNIKNCCDEVQCMSIVAQGRQRTVYLCCVITCDVSIEWSIMSKHYIFRLCFWRWDRLAAQTLLCGWLRDFSFCPPHTIELLRNQDALVDEKYTKWPSAIRQTRLPTREFQGPHKQEGFHSSSLHWTSLNRIFYKSVSPDFLTYPNP